MLYDNCLIFLILHRNYEGMNNSFEEVSVDYLQLRNMDVNVTNLFSTTALRDEDVSFFFFVLPFRVCSGRLIRAYLLT